MEFNQKLQVLRHRKGLTQEELAGALYVSRTAVSKCESGRGFPSIDSLKAIAEFFSVTIDELLSGDEIPPIPEKEPAPAGTAYHTPVFSILDISAALFFFLPFFGLKTDGTIRSVPLLSFTGTEPYLQTIYITVVLGMILTGILTLIMQHRPDTFRQRNRHRFSLLLNGMGILLFTVSLQPYAAVFLLLCMAVKLLLPAGNAMTRTVSRM